MGADRPFCVSVPIVEKARQDCKRYFETVAVGCGMWYNPEKDVII